MKKYLYPMLTLCWVALIFSFSLQPADASSQVSSGLLRTLLETFLPGLVERLSAAQLEMLELFVRKCAHFTEFAILGVFSTLTVAEFSLRRQDWCWWHALTRVFRYFPTDVQRNWRTCCWIVWGHWWVSGWCCG